MKTHFENVIVTPNHSHPIQICEVNDKFLAISTISPRFCLSADSFEAAKTRAINALKQYKL